MKTKWTWMIGSLLMVFTVFSSAHASTLSFYDGIDVMMNSQGTQDSGSVYLYAGQNMNVNKPFGLKYDSLLKFNDLFGADPGQIPVGSTITSASLHLYLYYDWEGYERGLYQMTEDWNASTRWNTLPGGGGIVPGVNTENTAVATWTGGAYPNQQWMDLDVTSSLQGWLGGEDQYGWGIWGEKAGNFSPAYINSFDNAANRPWLEVTYDIPQPPSVPEPGTMLVLLLGLGGAAMTRRNLQK